MVDIVMGWGLFLSAGTSKPSPFLLILLLHMFIAYNTLY